MHHGISIISQKLLTVSKKSWQIIYSASNFLQKTLTKHFYGGSISRVTSDCRHSVVTIERSYIAFILRSNQCTTVSVAGAQPRFQSWGVQHVEDAEVYFREYPPMTSAETRVYKGVWGLCPLWGPGTKPLVGGQGAKPPEADDISAWLYYIRELNLKLLT